MPIADLSAVEFNGAVIKLPESTISPLSNLEMDNRILDGVITVPNNSTAYYLFVTVLLLLICLLVASISMCFFCFRKFFVNKFAKKDRTIATASSAFFHNNGLSER